jgi:hypothetical protein
MPTNFRNAVRFPKPLVLGASLAAAIPLIASAYNGIAQAPKGPILAVDNCVDDGSPTSLRGLIAAAPDNSTIDLSQLACSKITLQQGVITVNQTNLALQGPSVGAGEPPGLTIDANNASRVFLHIGLGNFGLSNLAVEHGNYSSTAFAEGGCVMSFGNVGLSHSVVSHCTLEGTSATIAARGGGVYVHGSLNLDTSTISDSHVSNVTGGGSEGGGAFVAGDFFQAFTSTISNNSAYAPQGDGGTGGGFVAMRNAEVRNSTISDNSAKYAGALAFKGTAPFTAGILTSTISGNVGTQSVGGVLSAADTTIANSTIAFNRSANEIFGYSEGVFFQGPLTLTSSIIASNVGPLGLSDLGSIAGEAFTASNNLITASSVPLTGTSTITECAKLEPLHDNGGPTLTHALKLNSPAIEMGVPGPLNFDQRHLPRVAGAAADIGAVEMQAGEWDDRISMDGFDDVCVP